VRDLPDLKCEIEKLPYVKRKPFATESEYRIIVTSDKKQEPTLVIEIDLNIIEKITISNKMPEGVYNSLIRTLQEIVPHFSDRFHRSTLYNNAKWIDHL
jgi:hypothetical protein